MQDADLTITATAETTCAICGCEHDAAEVPDNTSMRLCAACSSAERRIRFASLTIASRRR